MKLNQKQLKSIADLKKVGVTDPFEILEWTRKKMKQSSFSSSSPHKRAGRRRHSREHYKGIHDHYSGLMKVEEQESNGG